MSTTPNPSAPTVSFVPAVRAQKCASDRNAELLREALNHPNWPQVWGLLNAFASGKTQAQFARVEPLAVLSEIYLMLAQIHTDQKKAVTQSLTT